MKRHERDVHVRKASLQIEMKISDMAREYDLTDVEVLQMLVSYQQSTLKYMLREERHGDRDKPGGLA